MSLDMYMCVCVCVFTCSVKNHFNALLRSKYLDSKKDSVLANYVRLLREGQQQSQATYEAALALTQQHREEAMNIIAKQVRVHTHTHAHI